MYKNTFNRSALNLAILMAISSPTLAESVRAQDGGNQPPLANDQTVQVDEGESKLIELNGSDPESQPITYTITSVPSFGGLSFEGASQALTVGSSFTASNVALPKLVYTPLENFDGQDSFTFLVNDGVQDSTEDGVVTIEINGINDTPYARDQVVNMLEDKETTFMLEGGDVDSDDELTLDIDTSHLAGTLAKAFPTFTFTPREHFNGPTYFTYTLTDKAGAVSRQATVSMNIAPVNDAPTVDDRYFATVEGRDVHITLYGSDIDGDGLTPIFIANSFSGDGELDTTNLAHGYVVYTPPNDLSQKIEATFQYKVSDGQLESGVSTVTITTQPENDAPIAQSGNVNVVEDVSTVIDLADYVTDEEGDALTFQVIETPKNGTYDVNTKEYTSNTNYFGPDSFRFTATDSKGAVSKAATMYIAVTPDNDAPEIAGPSEITVDQNSEYSQNVNASDVEENPLTYSLSGAPEWLSISATGQLEGTPVEQTEVKTHTFNIVVSDGEKETTKSVTITVTDQEFSPITKGTSVITEEDVAVEVDLATLSSDIDGDETIKSYAIVENGDNGSASIVENILTYTPAAEFSGSDNVTFKAIDDTGLESTPASISIDITNVLDAPEAKPGTMTVDEDSSNTIDLKLLYSDVDSPDLKVTVGQPSNGSISVSEDNVVTYTPNSDFDGNDSFAYIVNDGEKEATASISVSVNPINDLPIAKEQTVSVDQGGSIDITLTGQDIDNEQNELTYYLESVTEHGLLTDKGLPNVTYVASSDFSGTESFTYKVKDLEGYSETKTVYINVIDVNNAPKAINQVVITDEDVPVTFALLVEDEDVDNLKVSITQPIDFEAGHVVVTNANNVTFTPSLNHNGVALFKYTVTDNEGLTSQEVGVTLIINPVNDAPNAGYIYDYIDEDSDSNSIDLLSQAHDVDYDLLNVTDVGEASHGTVTWDNASRSVEYTPDTDYFGNDSFSFTISDGEFTDTGSVSISVSNVNDPLIVVDGTLSADEDKKATLDLSTLVTDIDNESLEYVLTSEHTGEVSISGSTLSYTSALNEFGSDEVSFNVESKDEVVSAKVAVTIHSVNDLPDIVTGEVIYAEEDTQTAITYNLRNLVTDVEDDSDDNKDLTLSSVVADNGVVIFDAETWDISYLPNANFSGRDEIHFTVTDSDGGESKGLIGADIAAVNDAPELVENPEWEILQAQPTLSESVNIDTQYAFTSSDGYPAFIAIDMYGQLEIQQLEDDMWVVKQITPAVNSASEYELNSFKAKFDDAGNIHIAFVTVPFAESAADHTINYVRINSDMQIVAEKSFVGLAANTPYSFDIHEDNPYFAFVGTALPSKFTSGADAENLHVVKVTESLESVFSYTSFQSINPELGLEVDVRKDGTIDLFFDLPDAGEHKIYSLTYKDDAIKSVRWITSLPGLIALTDLKYIGDNQLVGIAEAGQIDDLNSDVHMSNSSYLAFSYEDGSNEIISLPLFNTDKPRLSLVNDNELYLGYINPRSGASETKLWNTKSGRFELLSAQPYDLNEFREFGASYTSAGDALYAFSSIKGIPEDYDAQPEQIKENVKVASLELNPVLWEGTSYIKVEDAPTFTLVPESVSVIDMDSINGSEVITATFTLINKEHGTLDTSAVSDDVVIEVTEESVDGITKLLVALTGETSDVDTAVKVVKFAPAEHFHGESSLNLVVVDEAELFSNNATIDLIFIPVNDEPIAEEGVIVTDEDATKTFDLATLVTEVDGEALVYTVEQPTNGSVYLDGSLVTYTPNDDFNTSEVSESFTYTVVDAVDELRVLATNTITVTVNPLNDVPVVSVGDLTVTENSTELLDLSSLVVDVDGDELTYTLTSMHAGGNVSINGTTLSYTASPEMNGEGDVVTFTVSDGTATIASTVVVSITPVDDAPIAKDGVIVTDEDASKALDLAMLVTELDGDILNYSVSQPANGSVSLNGSIVTYTPNADFNTSEASESFTYTVLDAADESRVLATQTIRVTVNANNDAPVVSVGELAVTEDATEVLDLSSLVVDVDGDELTYTLTSMHAGGNVSINGTTLSYTASPEMNGEGDVVTFTVSDGTATVASTVAVTITPVDDAPIARAGFIMTDEDTPGTIDLAELVTDLDGDEFKYSIDEASHGSVVMNGSKVKYTPTTDFNGTDTFTYTVVDARDEARAFATQTITVTVNPLNDKPEVVAGELEVAEDGTELLDLSSLVVDVDGDELTYTLTSVHAGGNVSITGSTLSYTTSSEVNGEDTVTFTVSDGLESIAGFVVVTITPVDDAPHAADDHFELMATEENIYTLDVLSNDFHPDGSAFEIVSATTSHGSVSIVNSELVLSLDLAVEDVSLHYFVESTANDEVYRDDATVTVKIDRSQETNAPVIVLPDDIEIDADALFTKVDLGTPTATDSLGNSVPVSLIDGVTLFAPGVNKAYWEATDEEGNQTIETQMVVVHPLVSLPKDAKVQVEDNSPERFYEVEVILNGEAPQYPISIPYTVNGEYQTDLVISEGTTGIIFIEISQYIGGAVEVELVEDMNAIRPINIGEKGEFTLTVTTEAIEPEVSSKVTQAGEARQVVNEGETVSIAVVVDNALEGETFDYEWTNVREDKVVGMNSDSYSYSPVITSGMAQNDELRVMVTNVETGLSTQHGVFIEVREQLAVLDPTLDTDGDMIPDSEEGYADSDQDGMPDYMDAIAECNVMQERADNADSYLVEAEPGLCLRKGVTVANNYYGGVQLDIELDNLVEDTEKPNVGGVFDFVITGLKQPGDYASIAIPQANPIPENALYTKYDAEAGTWSEFKVGLEDGYLSSTQGEPGYCPPPANPVTSELWNDGLTAGDWCIQLTIKDGGQNDADGIANGTVVDPGGVSIPLQGNELPVANDDAYVVYMNGGQELNVLENDSDAEGQLTITDAVATLGGVSIVSGTSIWYEPPVDQIGEVTITYSVTDDFGAPASAQATITIIDSTPSKVEGSTSGGSFGWSILSLLGLGGLARRWSSMRK